MPLEPLPWSRHGWKTVLILDKIDSLWADWVEGEAGCGRGARGQAVKTRLNSSSAVQSWEMALCLVSLPLKEGCLLGKMMSKRPPSSVHGAGPGTE